MKTLSDISYKIAWGGLINLVISMLIALMFKILVDLRIVGSDFEIAATVITFYGIYILVVCIAVANKIDAEIERRMSIRKAKRKLTPTK